MKNKEKELRYTAGGIVAHYYDKKWQYLMLKQQRSDLDGVRWALPKGHLEVGESVENAARREILEEKGLNNLQFVTHLGIMSHEMIWRNILNDKIVYMDAFRENQECIKVIHLLLFISPNSGVILNTDEGFIGIQWVNSENIKEYLSIDHALYSPIMKADSIMNAFK